MQIILDYWWVWGLGTMVFPLLVVLPQLHAVRYAIDDKGKNPEAVAKKFLSPVGVTVSVLFGIGTFVSFLLLLTSLLLGIINYIKN